MKLRHIMKLIPKLFIWIETFFEVLGDIATWLLLFIFNPGHEFKEVRQRELRYPTEEKTEDFASNSAQPEYVIDLAKSCYMHEINRGKIIDEKNRILLTVCSLLLLTIGVVLAHTTARFLVVFSISALISSLYLILMYFRIRVVQAPDWMEASNYNEDEAKVLLARDYYSSSKQISASNDFRAGVYKASSRIMLLGLLAIIPLLVTTVPNMVQVEQETGVQVSSEAFYGSETMGPQGSKNMNVQNRVLCIDIYLSCCIPDITGQHVWDACRSRLLSLLPLVRDQLHERDLL